MYRYSFRAGSRFSDSGLVSGLGFRGEVAVHGKALGFKLQALGFKVLFKRARQVVEPVYACAIGYGVAG